MKPGQVFVVGDGKISCLSSDNIDLRQIGRVELKRASHVDGSADLSDNAIAWLVVKTPQRFSRRLLAYCRSGRQSDWPIGGLRQELPTDIWWADLLPSNGPVLGPFDTRTEALDAEVAWLREHEFKVPKPDCTGEAESGNVAAASEAATTAP